MGKITANIRFKLDDDKLLSEGIDDHQDLNRYTFAEWIEHPSTKFLNVGESFLYEEEQYIIDTIYTKLEITPDQEVPEDQVGKDSILTIDYYVSKA